MLKIYFHFLFEIKLSKKKLVYLCNQINSCTNFLFFIRGDLSYLRLVNIYRHSFARSWCMVEIVPGVLWEIKKRSCPTKFTINWAQILCRKNLHSNSKGFGGKTIQKNPYVFFKMVSIHFHPYYSFFKVVLGPLPLTCCSQLWANITNRSKWISIIVGCPRVDRTNIQIYLDTNELTKQISKYMWMVMKWPNEYPNGFGQRKNHKYED